MKRRHRVLSAALASVALTVGVVASAASTTYVATYGSDANSCSLALPCRSFSGALVQTNDGGQIVALDSGGYAAVRIDKSVSLIAPEGIYAGISVFNGTGVEITGTATQVNLSGLTIVAVGGSTGVYVSVPVELSIERVVISGFSEGMILCKPLECLRSGAGALRIVDSTMYSNDTGINADPAWSALVERSLFIGDRVFASAAVADSLFAFGGFLQLTSILSTFGGGSVQRSVFSDSGDNGLNAIGWGSVPAAVSLSRTVFVRTRAGVAIGTGLAGPTAIDIDSCVFADNAQYGIDHTSIDPAANVTLSNNTIARNTIGGVLNYYSAPIYSRGNNTIRNNGVDGGPFVPLPGL